MAQEPPSHRAYTSPSHFLAVIAASVFSAEVLVVMILLVTLPSLHYAIAAPLDALLTTILVYPMLRRFVVRPMSQHIDERRQAEAALSRAYAELESRVRERTAELAQANESLQIEIAGHQRAREELKVALDVSQQRQAEVVGLLKGARAVLEYRDFREVAQAILKVCKEMIGATAGYVAVPSEDRANEKIVFFDFEDSAQAIDHGLLKQIRGLRAQVYSTGKAVCVNDYASNEGAETLPEGHMGVSNIIVAPMVIKGFVVGLVCLADKLGGFSDNDVRITTAFAELAAISLLNSQTLELLESSEKRSHTLAQATFEGIAFSEKGIIRQVNEQFAQIYGYEVSDIIGKPITDFLASEHHEQVMQIVMSGEDHVGEYRALRKDGSTILLEARGRSIWQFGRLVRVTAIRDITERKRAEEALRESEKRFRLALKNAPVSVAAQDRDLHFLWAYNQRTVDPSAVIGKTDTDVFPPEDAARLIALKRKVLETETETREQFWLTSGGQRVFLDLYLEPMRDATGQVTGIGVATVDLTQMKLADEALRESEERLRALYASMTEGLANYEVVYADGEAVDYIITDVNPAFERLTGLARSEAVGRKASELHSTGSLPYLDVYAKVASGGAPEDFETYIPPMKKHFAISVFSPEKGKFATVFTDITERKRAEETTAWLASFPELNPNPISEVDLAGRLHYLNPVAKRLLPDLAAMRLQHPWLVELESVGKQLQLNPTKVLTREVTIDEAIYQQTLHFVSSYQRIRIYGLDITRRKRMEEALRRAHDELESRIEERTKELAQANEELRLQMTAVRAAANGIVITDRQGNVRWSNPAFTQMTGYTSEEALGRNMRLLKSNEQSPEFYQYLWETILAGSVWKGELINRRKDGSLYVEEQTIAPVLNEQGQIANFVAVKQDVTERKRAEARLRQNNRDLLALSQAERDQRQLTETLAAANSALTQSLDLEAVLEALLEHVERLVPYDSANVMLLEAESRLSVRVTRGYERWGGAELVRAISFDVQANSVLNTLLTTRRSSLVSDTHTQPGWETPPGVEHVRSWLGVPLMAGGNIIGVYSLDKTEPGFFTAEHVRKAEMLAGQAAVAIQNAWLFEQVRAGRERHESLSRRLVEVQEAERQYVARELHDEAGQALTSLLFGLGQIEQQMDSPRQAAHVVELKEMTHGIIESLHRLAMDLRPASLDHLGLVPALLQYVKAIGDRYGLTARFKAVGLESERLPSEVETALYRIVQEALTNIIRHARATRIDVLLERRDDRAVLVVEDNGIGFDADITHFMQEGHLGLAGIQERAEMLGGSLIIESTAGTGTTIVVEVPNGDSYSGR